MLANIMVNGGHRLDRARSRAREGEFAIGHFALVKGERSVTEDDKTAVAEHTALILVEIEDDFFVSKFILGDLHWVCGIKIKLKVRHRVL